jgi:hypothetical protein
LDFCAAAYYLVESQWHCMVSVEMEIIQSKYAIFLQNIPSLPHHNKSKKNTLCQESGSWKKCVILIPLYSSVV